MSTKAIEALIEKVRTGDVLSSRDADAAEREVEDLHKAAKAIDENVTIPAIPSELEPALRLMERIAKDAP